MINTSDPRTLSLIFTNVSSFENLKISASLSGMPASADTSFASSGFADPEKIFNFENIIYKYFTFFVNIKIILS
jgi:hypothetical protein